MDLEDADLKVRKDRQQEKIRERSRLLKNFNDEQKKRKRKQETKIKNSPCYDPIYERRFSVIASSYVKSFFIFDILACLPVFLSEARYSFTTDPFEKHEQIETAIYQIFMSFKIFKLLMILRVFNSL